MKIDKVVAALPSTLEADTAYAVRAGVGFDLYISDSTGATAHKLNDQRHWQQMPIAGRLYCYENARWIASACDDNYGPAYYQWTENAGTGADPLEEWEHKGFFIREGTVCKELSLFGRGLDINSVADLEIFISFVDSNGRWDTVGIDSDGEDNHTLLYRGLWLGDGAQTASINDDIRRNFALSPNNDGTGDFVAPADGNLRLYMRPINIDPRPDTANDYAQLSGSWLISYNDEDMA